MNGQMSKGIQKFKDLMNVHVKLFQIECKKGCKLIQQQIIYNLNWYSY